MLFHRVLIGLLPTWLLKWPWLLICAYHCPLVPLLMWHSFPGACKPSRFYLFFETFLDCPHLFVKNCQAHVDCLYPYLSCLLCNGKHRYQLICSNSLTFDELTIGKYTVSKGTREYPSQEREELCCIVLCPLCSYLVLPPLLA